MLKQHNFQITKPKKRKLFTPLSDEEENLDNEIKSTIDLEKVELDKIENVTTKSTEQTQKNERAFEGNVYNLSIIYLTSYTIFH